MCLALNLALLFTTKIAMLLSLIDSNFLQLYNKFFHKYDSICFAKIAGLQQLACLRCKRRRFSLGLSLTAKPLKNVALGALSTVSKYLLDAFYFFDFAFLWLQNFSLGSNGTHRKTYSS